MGRVGDVRQELYAVNTGFPALSAVIELVLRCSALGDWTPFWMASGRNTQQSSEAIMGKNECVTSELVDNTRTKPSSADMAIWSILIPPKQATQSYLK